MSEKDKKFIFGYYNDEPIYLTSPSEELTCNGCEHSYKPPTMYPCYRCIRQVIGDYFKKAED